MKLIIAGSRNMRVGNNLIDGALNCFEIFPSTVISGHAAGVDSRGEAWAYQNKVLLEIHRAEWGKHGRAAGPIRNKKMAGIADGLLLIWDGQSRGSLSMKNEMMKLNKPVYEVILRGAVI